MKNLFETSRRLSESSNVEKIGYTDAELLDFLLENNKVPNYTNLCILKENILSGKIKLMKEQNAVETNGVDKETIEQAELIDDKNAAEDVENLKEFEDFKMVKKTNVRLTPEMLAKDLVEHSFFNDNLNERLIESFLLEDCNGDIQFTTLNEEVRSESIKAIAVSLLKTLEEKIAGIDTTVADRSRGDIAHLNEITSISNTIGNLEELIERDPNATAEYSKAINVIIKSIRYINQYSSTFKDAYRNKKSLMIMKYQALILSIISSVTYLLSTIVSIGDNVTLKATTENLLDFAPLKSLNDFNTSVESGEFKIITRDVNVLREYYLELSVGQMSSILEAVEYGPMIIDGIKNFYNNLINGNAKLTNLIYKAAGVFVILLSLRDVLYTLFKMKTKVVDMLQGINLFGNLGQGGGILNKLTSFTNKFKSDASFASEMTKREIEDENRGLLKDIKEITYQQEHKIEEPVEVKASEPAQPAVQPATNNDFLGFDF